MSAIRKLLAPDELERLTRRYTTEIINEIGPEKDIPAPDVGTNSQVMAWIFDTYSMNVGHSVLGVVTGKPLAIGGSVGRDGATARGVLYCIRTALQKEGRRFPDTRMAIQGFGNVGRNLARLLSEEGARVIALSDSRGAVVNQYGIDVQAAIAHKSEHGVLEGLPGTEEATNEELIELECDVLVPAALEQAITADNAPRVKAHMICEAANGATTPGGDEILEDRGVLVLPDVVANAGGVVVSYFEWVQGLQEYFWKEYEVNAKLNDIVVRAFEETWSARERFATSMRMAAYGLAVQRVAEATTSRAGSIRRRQMTWLASSSSRRPGCHLCGPALDAVRSLCGNVGSRWWTSRRAPSSSGGIAPGFPSSRSTESSVAATSSTRTSSGALVGTRTG